MHLFKSAMMNDSDGHMDSHHRQRRVVVDMMKGAIGMSQNVMMKGRDWLTNEKHDEAADDDIRVKKKPRLSLYGKATVEQIRADYNKYAECLAARKNMYLANIDEPHSLINFIYLDSYEGQQLPCTAWYHHPHCSPMMCYSSLPVKIGRVMVALTAYLLIIVGPS